MDLSAPMLCLDDSTSPDKTVSMLLDVYSGWRDQGKEMSPELLTSIFQEVSLNKTPKKEIPVHDDCEVVLSDFSTLLKVVQQMEDTVQELRFANQALQKELEAQNQQVVTIQHSTGWKRIEWIELDATETQNRSLLQRLQGMVDGKAELMKVINENASLKSQ